jgi:hypothetical protein
MTRRKVLKRREKIISNCEVIPEAIWHIVMSLMKRDGLKVPTAIHGPLGLKYQHLDKATTTVNCVEDQFTPHNLCDENRKRQVDARVQALLEAADDTPLQKVRPCDIQKLIKLLKLRKACGA